MVKVIPTLLCRASQRCTDMQVGERSTLTLTLLLASSNAVATSSLHLSDLVLKPPASEIRSVCCVEQRWSWTPIQEQHWSAAKTGGHSCTNCTAGPFPTPKLAEGTGMCHSRFWEGHGQGNAYFVMLALKVTVVCCCTLSQKHCTDMEVRMLTCMVATSALCARDTKLAPIDHWLRHVETARFLSFIEPFLIPTPRGALGCGAAWRTAQRTTWAAVPHWPRGNFTDGQRLDAQLQDWRALLCELRRGGPFFVG